jgi:cytochrome c biogenesis protein CcmG/thiol:disulfide interchange protein DsbE
VRPFLTAVLALVAAVASGCAGSSDDVPSPFAGCDGITGAPTPAAPTLPDLKLGCFTGDDQVALRALPGPVVINLWASWCDPCRRELPVMQQLADKADGRLTVIGVDTGDGRDAGASFAAAKSVSLPTLFDPDKKLANAVAGTALPITIFMDASGKSYVNRLPLDATKLTQLVKEHTGVTVTL